MESGWWNRTNRTPSQKCVGFKNVPVKCSKLPDMTPQADESQLRLQGTLSIDVLDEESGMAEVELLDAATGQGRSFELPARWLPDAAEGLAYEVTVRADGVAFTPLVGGARILREHNKQTLLEFSDEHEPGEQAGAER